jgi:hypothetical protein
MKFPSWLKVYGDTSYRGECPSETIEAITFFAQLRREYPDTYGLIATHIRNEGKRSWEQVARQKAEGMTKGAPDIIIPTRRAFVCEMKRRDHTKSKWQPMQLEYLKSAHDAGAFVCVALGYDAAYSAFQDSIV